MIKSLKVKGTSMRPLFNQGEYVLIKYPFIPEKGDCVVYNHNNKKFLHRIIKTEPDGVWISDDSGIIEPHFVTYENLEGKVLSKNPFTSGLLGFLYYKIKSIYKHWFIKMFQTR